MSKAKERNNVRVLVGAEQPQKQKQQIQSER